MPQITVVGSVNLDLVATAPALPRPGETVTDAEFSRHPGGKGANQAMAARRMGSDVRLVAAVGVDSVAEEALGLLRSEGVDLTAVRRHPAQPTGVALIVVAPDGENQIVVAPGANRLLSPADVDVTGSDMVVCQLEIPVEVVAAAVEAASFSVLNCAPARPLPDELLAGCDVVVVNRTEREFYGAQLGTVPVLIETLGPDGATVSRWGRPVVHVPAPEVVSIDAVGAGDTFVGTLASELASGVEMTKAIRTATVAGALATTRSGAQESTPTRDEVMEAMSSR
jgi:ribokinase